LTTLKTQELQIIQAFSSLDVPERIIRDSNIKELLQGMLAEQDAIQSDARRLERLRQEKKDGNFIGNWLKDRDDKVQDAQIDLNKSIGRLTQKSSQLLIVNTAISKVLNDQQRILLEQQNILKQQADTLADQNSKILEQQNLLARQQQDINKANQGLMEAKGITQEQAQQLVGCVKLVKEAEIRISAANQSLMSRVEQKLHDSVEQCLGRLSNGFAEQVQRHAALEQQLTSAFSTQSQHAQAELARVSSETAEFKINIGQQLQAHIHTVQEKTAAQAAAAQQLHEAIRTQLEKLQQDVVAAVEQQVLALRETVNGFEKKHEAVQQEQATALQAQRDSLVSSVQRLEANLSDKAEVLNRTEAQLTDMHAEQQKSASKNRLAFAAVACLALASLGWQVAQHFALV
jgi:hypothetical protein